MSLSTAIQAIITNMTSLIGALWTFGEGAVIGTVVMLPVVGGLIARVASVSRKARG